MRRRARLAAAAVALLAVCVATLTPSGGVDNIDFWCLACGELGGLDVIANIVMFVPLGLTLALVFERSRPAVLLCVATTLIVEILQIRIVTGRDASLSDLLANTLGGALGANLATTWPVLVKPTAKVAQRLALGWAMLVLGVLGVTSWGLEPADVPTSLWVQRTPPRPSYEPFTGKLLAFDVDGMNIPDRFPERPRELQEYLSRDTWTATVVVDTRGLQPTRSIIIRVAEDVTVLVWMDQVGWNLTCLQKTRSAYLRIRSPKVALVDGLKAPDGGPSPSDSAARLSCSRRHATLDASATIGGVVRDYRLPLSPSLGWLLLSPFDLAFDRRYYAASALWLVALLFPAGFWSTVGRSAEIPGRRAALGGIGFAVTGIALFVGLAIAPRLFDVSIGAWWEWCAAIGGIVLGSAARRLVVRSAQRDAT